jgi:CheY-like chemotaxis protein
MSPGVTGSTPARSEPRNNPSGHRHTGQDGMKQRSSYRVAVAGLDERDVRLIEIVLGHGQYNPYEFVLLDSFDPGAVDLLIVDTEQEDGRRALAALQAAGREVPTIGAVARGGRTAAKHSIAIERLTLQLLPILNRVVEVELLDPKTRPVGASAAAMTAVPAPVRSAAAVPAAAASAAARGSETAAGVPTRPVPRHVNESSAERSACDAVARLRVLIVDDSATVRQQLLAAFEHFGMAAETAESGEEALRRLAERHVDLMMLDINLPGIDGFTVLRALREQTRWRRLPVLVLTSRASPLDRARGLLAGADVYLAKPVRMAELSRVVAAELRRSLRVDDLTRWFAPTAEGSQARLASA